MSVCQTFIFAESVMVYDFHLLENCAFAGFTRSKQENFHLVSCGCLCFFINDGWLCFFWFRMVTSHFAKKTAWMSVLYNWTNQPERHQSWRTGIKDIHAQHSMLQNCSLNFSWKCLFGYRQIGAIFGDRIRQMWWIDSTT